MLVQLYGQVLARASLLQSYSHAMPARVWMFEYDRRSRSHRCWKWVWMFEYYRRSRSHWCWKLLWHAYRPQEAPAMAWHLLGVL